MRKAPHVTLTAQDADPDRKMKTRDPRLLGYDAVFFIAGISSVGLKEEH